MLVDGVHYRTIFLHEQDASVVRIIDQRKLPHLFEIEDLRTWEEMAVAIKDMHVRGAGLVGASAGFGMYLAALAAPRESEAAFKSFVEAAGEALKATRPTAVNLECMVTRQLATMEAAGPDLAVNLECMVTRQLATMEAAGPDLAGKVAAAKAGAIAIADEDAEFCRRLREHGKKLIAEISEKKGGLVPDLCNGTMAGEHGKKLIAEISERKGGKTWRLGEHGKKLISEISERKGGKTWRLGEHGKKLISEISEKKGGAVVNVLTHCNAGWLAFVDVGSATAPIYAAHDAGIKVHVFVDETRPRNQGASLTAWELGKHGGASLTAWELGKHGVPHTLVADNTGGHLMQHGMVDLVITGADRVLAKSGDVCNKIGTYLKALAAKDNNIPMFVALPSSTFDWVMLDGVKQIPIESRGEREVKYISGLDENGEVREVLLCPPGTPAANYAFDVTPARLITSLITERGVCPATGAGVLSLFPERSS